jgi:uncharacterized protein YbjT (DUF2867 family)
VTPAGEREVVVFGGTGFLGRRVVRRLHEKGFCVRIASRHPQQGDVPTRDDSRLQPIEVDIHDDRSVTNALAGAYAAVNAVSLYVERGAQTFHAVHVDAARRVAAEARRAGAQRLVHVSGIGADTRSPSLYIRKRGEGEDAVREAFADAVIVRPAVMFATDDAFLTAILGLLRQLPVYPLFGSGRTRLQPAYVEDVGEAIASVLIQSERPSATVECAGPRIYTYKELIESIARAAALRRLLIPVPFVAWRMLAEAAAFLPSPPITRNQVELMEIDSVQSPAMPGFAELGIVPRSVEDVLREMLGR